MWFHTLRTMIYHGRSNRRQRPAPTIAIVGPWPIAGGDDPPSGVANYLKSVLLAGSIDQDVHVVAQHGCTQELAANHVTVHPSWRPGMWAWFDIIRTLRGVRPDIIHLHHEFRLFGGVAATAAVLLAVVVTRPSARLVTTIHGVVPKARAIGPLFGAPDHWLVTWVARTLLALNYRLLGIVSDELVVLHVALQRVLREDYGLSSLVVPLGSPPTVASRAAVKVEREPNTVMIFGFLTVYKRPELVLELAEQNLLPGTRYIMSVGLNPRVKDRGYQLRYESLRTRAETLADRVTWHNYLPEEVLSDLLSQVSILVLPYTELVAATAVGTQALGSGVAICHSVALEPIFGSGPTMFELTPTSLRSAILAARMQAPRPAVSLPSWGSVLQQTMHVWHARGSR